MEVQALHTRCFTGSLRIRQQFLLRYPLADGRRAVETFADCPGLTCLRGFLLQVTGRKVDTDGQGIIITVGKAYGDILPQAADAHHHLRLIVDAPQMIRNKERFPLIQNGRIGLGKYHRLFRAFQRPVELLVMGGIVHANSEYLHDDYFCAKISKISETTK